MWSVPYWGKASRSTLEFPTFVAKVVKALSAASKVCSSLFLSLSSLSVVVNPPLESDKHSGATFWI